MAVASVGLHENNLHLTLSSQPCQHLITVAGWTLFLAPNQQCQSNEGKFCKIQTSTQYPKTYSVLYTDIPGNPGSPSLPGDPGRPGDPGPPGSPRSPLGPTITGSGGGVRPRSPLAPLRPDRPVSHQAMHTLQ